MYARHGIYNESSFVGSLNSEWLDSSCFENCCLQLTLFFLLHCTIILIYRWRKYIQMYLRNHIKWLVTISQEKSTSAEQRYHICCISFQRLFFFLLWCSLAFKLNIHHFEFNTETDLQRFGVENKDTEVLSFRQVYGCFFQVPDKSTH